MDEREDPFGDGEWLPTEEAIALLNDIGVRDMARHFNCLMLSQGAITDEARELLMRTAVHLVCLKRRQHRIKTDWCEGEVTTNFTTASIETISGVKFECVLDVGTKRTKAAFIITSSLLDRFPAASWIRNRADEGPPLKTSVFN